MKDTSGDSNYKHTMLLVDNINHLEKSIDEQVQN